MPRSHWTWAELFFRSKVLVMCCRAISLFECNNLTASGEWWVTYETLRSHLLQKCARTQQHSGSDILWNFPPNKLKTCISPLIWGLQLFQSFSFAQDCCHFKKVNIQSGIELFFCSWFKSGVGKWVTGTFFLGEPQFMRVFAKSAKCLSVWSSLFTLPIRAGKCCQTWTNWFVGLVWKKQMHSLQKDESFLKTWRESENSRCCSSRTTLLICVLMMEVGKIWCWWLWVILDVSTSQWYLYKGGHC